MFIGSLQGTGDRQTSYRCRWRKDYETGLCEFGETVLVRELTKLREEAATRRTGLNVTSWDPRGKHIIDTSFVYRQQQQLSDESGHPWNWKLDWLRK